jgi:hypothetical protein
MRLGRAPELLAPSRILDPNDDGSLLHAANAGAPARACPQG